MANSLVVKVTEEGPRNTVVKVVGVVDSGDMNVQRALILSSLSNDDKAAKLTGLRLDSAKYTVTNGLVVLLSWNSNSPELMAAISESGELDLRPEGGFPPDRTVSGYEGSINLSTRGFVAGTPYGFTWLLRMKDVQRVTHAMDRKRRATLHEESEQRA
jgi:hypothetical protein